MAANRSMLAADRPYGLRAALLNQLQKKAAHHALADGFVTTSI
jgi:hypothetical protein